MICCAGSDSLGKTSATFVQAFAVDVLLAHPIRCQLLAVGGVGRLGHWAIFVDDALHYNPIFRLYKRTVIFIMN